MTMQTCINVTKQELGTIIKDYMNKTNHRFGGLMYAPKQKTLRIVDMDGNTTIDDILKEAFGIKGYAGYNTTTFPNLISIFYNE